MQFKCNKKVIVPLLMTIAFYDGISGAQTLTVLKSFDFADGSSAYGTPVLSSNVLYGTTSSGGTANFGTLFKINTDGSGFALLKTFDGSGPKAPLAKLVLSQGTLYGSGVAGGSSGNGALFKIKTDGSGYTVIKDFASTDGAGPRGGMVISGSTLYGTTYYGGTWDLGTIFKINADGTGFAVVREFTPYDGANPAGDLILAGKTLYGTTYSSGGTNGTGGTVYKINTDGSGFKVLKSFGYLDGNHPYAGLVLAGGNLYGAAYSSGSNSCGTLFTLTTNGTGFALLRTFNGSDGANPYSSLTLVSNTLYGTTYNGGSFYSLGAVFKMNTDGTGYELLRGFNINDPEASPAITRPYAGVVASGTTLYGVTSLGGAKACGAIFSLTTLATKPYITSQPLSCTNLPGTIATFQVTAAGTSPIYYLWLKDGAPLNEVSLVVGVRSNLLTLKTLSASDAGNYSVVVSNSTGSVTSSIATLVIKGPPVAMADSVEVPLGLPIAISCSTLLTNDFDPGGEPVFFKTVESTSASGVYLTLANGVITYWGAFAGKADRFNYSITNASGLSGSGIVNINLTDSLPDTNQLALFSLPGGAVRLIFYGHSTLRYSFDLTHDLSPPAKWEPLQTNWAGAQGYTVFTNWPLPGVNNFYRVRRVLTFP